MDYIRFHCPACNHLLVVPPEAAGLSGPCPQCHTIIQGPNQPAPQPQPLNPPPSEPSPEPEVTVTPEEAPYSEPSLATEQREASIQSEPLIERLESEEEEMPDIAPVPQSTIKTRRQGGLSFLQALLLCFFFSVAFFVLGFFLGKSGSVSWEDLLQKREQEVGEIEPGTITAAPSENDDSPIAITPLPDEEGSLSTQTGDSLGAQASLEAFLGAETWSARNAYVLYPNLVIADMEASANFHGDGPISINSLSLKQDRPNQKVFWLDTPHTSRPFSVVLIQNGGNWLVDWPGFADFYHNRLQAFAEGREGPMQGAFRVFLKAAPGETSPLSPSRCLVMAPQNEGAFQTNSAAGSNARKKLAEIFQNYLQADPENFKQAMAGPGIPLIVRLSRNGAPNPTLLLEEILATGWPPLPPTELKKDNLSSFY